jgi:PilZ domain-containing protein
VERIEQALEGPSACADDGIAASGASTPERQLTLFRAGIITVAGVRELCVIRSICAEAMQIRTFEPIVPGERVSVEFKQGTPIYGTAQWAKGNLVGVNFDRPIDIPSILNADPNAPRARMPRIEIDCFVSVREEAKIARSKAVDISQGGVRVDCGERLTVGGNVVVTIPGLEPEPAVVRWHKDGRYGLGFHKVMPLSALADWLRSNRADTPSPLAKAS